MGQDEKGVKGEQAGEYKGLRLTTAAATVAIDRDWKLWESKAEPTTFHDGFARGGWEERSILDSHISALGDKASESNNMGKEASLEGFGQVIWPLWASISPPVKCE